MGPTLILSRGMHSVFINNTDARTRTDVDPTWVDAFEAEHDAMFDAKVAAPVSSSNRQFEEVERSSVCYIIEL